MIKLLSTICLVLTIVLFPPATLAVISNNAVPGDATYPIKRALEDGIFALASLNPTTKAWFSAARSDRRYKEFTSLVSAGKGGQDTLNELVEQTQVAASQIAQVNDEGQKQQLIEQLSQSIKKYDLGLQQISSSTPSNPVIVVQATPLPQATPIPQDDPNPTPAQARPIVSPRPGQTPVPISKPISTPAPTQSSVRPTPISVPTAISTPRPTPVPIPAPVNQNPNNANRQREIDEARRQLDEIRRRLEEEPRQQIRQESNDRKEAKQEKKEDSGGSEGRRKNNADTTK